MSQKIKYAFVSKLSHQIFLISFFLIINSLVAQQGPGGVGNTSNNPFWVRADLGTSTTTDTDPITSWQDVSGNNNTVLQTNAAQRPLYSESIMNGYPSILFDNNNSSGQNDFLTAPDAPNLDNTNGLTIFSVVRPTTTGSARSIVCKRTDVGVNQAYMFFFFTSNYLFTDVVSNNDRFDTNPVSFPANNNYILSFNYNGTLAAASRVQVYNGETLIKTGSESASTIPDYNSPLILGSTNIGDSRAFGGYMSEIIIYRKSLNITERVIVNNYLSAKYNIPLSSNDLYLMDNPANGNYDHDVAGIGRLTASDLSNDGKGSGIVRILNPTNLDNNEFLFWGHDNNVPYAFNFSDVPAGVEARFERVWRVNEVNLSGTAVNVGNIDMHFDLSQYSPVTASDLRLLVDTDNDGVFSDETPITGATHLGGGIYEFSGVSTIANTRRFTLATINALQTPLPVTLVDFSANLDNNKVSLKWQTSSEINNNYFNIERSRDSRNWEVISEVEGAGNSAEYNEYEAFDFQPFEGMNYYRLKQTDFNGEVDYTKPQFVKFNAQLTEFELFPNPNQGVFTIQNLAEGSLIKITDLAGKTVLKQFATAEVMKIDMLEHESGLYLVSVISNGQIYSKKVVVN